MGGDGEHHPHAERLAPLTVLRHHGLEGRGAHRGRHLARLRLGQLGRHGCPDAVRHRDGVAVEIHGKSRHQLGLGANADVGRQGLARQHLGAVQLAVYHPIQQDLPVRLGLQGHVEPLVLEVASLVGHRQRRHVSQLDEAEPQLLLLRSPQRQYRQRQRRQQQARTSLSSLHCISSLGSGSGHSRQAVRDGSAASLQRCDPNSVLRPKKSPTDPGSVGLLCPVASDGPMGTITPCMLTNSLSVPNWLIHRNWPYPASFLPVSPPRLPQLGAIAPKRFASGALRRAVPAAIAAPAPPGSGGGSWRCCASGDRPAPRPAPDGASGAPWPAR